MVVCGTRRTCLCREKRTDMMRKRTTTKVCRGANCQQRNVPFSPATEGPSSYSTCSLHDESLVFCSLFPPLLVSVELGGRTLCVCMAAPIPKDRSGWNLVQKRIGVIGKKTEEVGKSLLTQANRSNQKRSDSRNLHKSRKPFIQLMCSRLYVPSGSLHVKHEPR